MPTSDDKLLFDIDGRRLALELASVEGVAEVDRVFFLPGGRPPVMGVITHRSEPVMVVDMKRVFGKGRYRIEGPSTVIIVRDGEKVVGLCVGAQKLSFLWKKELADVKVTPSTDKYISATMALNDSTVEVVDCGTLYDETTSLLSKEEQDVKHPPCIK